MSDALPILLNDLAAAAVLFALLWAASLPIKDPSFVDAFWALGVVLLTWVNFAQIDAPGAHAYALLAIGSLWGLRLGAYLLWRWGKHGADRRYQKMAKNAKEKRGFAFPVFALLIVFLPQMLLQFVMALPVTLGAISTADEFGLLAKIGFALALFGIAFEAVADAQLSHFKSRGDNRGKVMDQGLWRYSRHPNYFGELCTWWGAYAVACETPLGGWTIFGPLLLTFLLTRVSGTPTTEPHLRETRPDYERYVQRTSAIIPLPPKG